MANTVSMYKDMGIGSLQAVVAKNHIKAHLEQGWIFADDAEGDEYFGILQGEAPIPGTTSIDKHGNLYKTDDYGNVVPVQRNPRFYGVLAEMREIHDAKNSDYANSTDPFRNFRRCEQMGIPAYEGIVVRLTDKLERVMNLIEKSKRGEGAAVKTESLRDTLMDIANYAALGVCLLDESTEVASE